VSTGFDNTSFTCSRASTDSGMLFFEISTVGKAMPRDTMYRSTSKPLPCGIARSTITPP